MAGLKFEYVGLIRPDAIADEMERVAKMIREGFTSGQLVEGGEGWWECDGVDEDADAEDDDEGVFDEEN